MKNFLSILLIVSLFSFENFAQCEFETFSPNSIENHLPNYLGGQSIVLSSTTSVYQVVQYITSGRPTGQFAIYSDNAGSPNTLLGYTNSSTLSPGYNRIPLTSPLTLSAGTYWLMVVWKETTYQPIDNTTTKSTPYRQLVYGQPLPTSFGTATAWTTGKLSKTLYVCDSPEINLKGNSTSITNGDATPSLVDDTDFGSVNLVSGTQVRTFTIENLGGADLTLSGSPKVTLTGTNASDFSVITQPTSTVTASSSTTFQISFDPSLRGTRSATVNISNSDYDENPYTFAIRGTAISPCEFETFNTNFASGLTQNILLGQSIVLSSTTTIYKITQYINSGNPTGQFAIYSDNAGSPNTLLGYTSYSGGALSPGYNEIPLTSPLTLSAGTYWLMAVWKDLTYILEDNTITKTTISKNLTYGNALPTSFGTANSFSTTKIARTFYVCASPDINLKGNSTSIANGDATPSTADHTDFGAVNEFFGTQVRTFTIENLGTGDLTLSGSPKVTITGTNASDFSVTTQPTSPVTAPVSTTFQVRFDPSAGGTRSATVNIPSNDSDENPYTFAIQGTGIASTRLSLTSGANPSIVGNNITFTATLTSNSVPLNGYIVTLSIAGGASYASLTNASGVATFTVSSLTFGIYNVTAFFGGSSNQYTASASTSISQLVNPTGSPFITRWNLATAGSGATQISFGMATSGTVNYSWQEVGGGGAKGMGSFSGTVATITGLPTGGTIDLSIFPANLQTFYINEGIDKSRLLDVKKWGDVAWSSMANVFYGCNNLNITATDVPNLSSVTVMYAMFVNCSTLNGPANINSWNTSTVTNMEGMFFQASAFNQPIDAWNISAVTNMKTMFYGATSFNQNLAAWGTKFNANVDLLGMLDYSGMSIANYDATLTGFNAGTVTGRSLGASGRKYCVSVADRANLIKPIAQGGKGWAISGDALAASSTPTTTANITTFNLSKTSLSATCASGTVAWYDANSTTLLSTTSPYVTPTLTANATYQVRCENGTCLGNFVTVNVTVVNPFITTWQTTAANESITIPTDGVSSYNYKVDWGDGNITTGHTGNATHTYTTAGTYDVKIIGAFPHISFNGGFNDGGNTLKIKNIKQWGDMAWTSMEGAFWNCDNLNVTATDVPNLSSVTNMSWMFVNCNILNGPTNINSWNTSTVTNMEYMFFGAASFNQPIGNWNISSVTNMFFMLYGTSAFNQSLAAWGPQLNANVNLAYMLHSSGMSVANYDATLMGFNAGTITDRNLGAGGLKYCVSAADRANLINVKGWAISGDSFVTPNPTVTPNPSICFNSSVSLSANCANGNVAWYDSNSSTLLATTPIYTTPNLTTNTAYTVRCESGTPPEGGCNSGFVSINVLVGLAASLPEINLQSNANTVPDGDNTPTASDHTDFGILNMSNNLERTFTIQNLGSGPLNIPLGGITSTGADASLFSIGGITLPITIEASGSATFTLTFAPGTAGFKTAIVNIVNDDCDENHYNFAVQGTGTPGCGSVTLTNTINPGSTITYTELEITASNQVSNALVTYQASTSVTLLPGFSATGNTFIAKIGRCGN